MGNCLPSLSKWKSSFRRKAPSTPPTQQAAAGGRQPRTAGSASAAPVAAEPKRLTRAEKRIAAEIAAHAARHASAQYPPAFELPSPAAGRRPAGADFESLNFAASFEAADATRRVGQQPVVKQEEEAKATTARSDPRRSFRRPRKGAYLASSALPPIPNADSPFDPLDTAPHHTNNLSISVQPDLFASLGALAQTGGAAAGAEAVSVSHNVSKNGVSFFPHFSFNDEGKEREEEEGEEVSAGGRTGGEEGEEEKSRLSSTEMDDDISQRYMTPTIASTHIVRPLPSPSSLSVPQPSIGSGINSSEHSIVQSTMTAPSAAYRAKSLPSTSASSASNSFFFSPKTGQEMYSDPDTATSPQSAAPHAAAASPPSATSPLAHAAAAAFARQFEPQPPSASVTAPHARGAAHPAYHPTATLQSPPAPAADHLTLNTNAVALASALFDDGAFGSRSAVSAGERFSAGSLQQQQQQRQQQLPQRASVGSIPQQRATVGPSLRPSVTYATNTSAASSQLADLSSAPSIHRHSSLPVELSAAASSSSSAAISSSPPASLGHLGLVDEIVSPDVSSASPGASGRVIARPALHAQSRSVSSLGAGGKAAERGSRSPVGAGSRSFASRRGREAAGKAGGASSGAVSDEDVGDGSRADGDGEDGNSTMLDSGGRRVR